MAKARFPDFSRGTPNVRRRTVKSAPMWTPGQSALAREHLSQQREPSQLRWDQIESAFDVCNPFKPVRHAETDPRIKDVRIAEMAHYLFKVL
jgi:hypothetical protein